MNLHRRPLADRFNKKVQRGGSCWLWTGATMVNGYGVIGVPVALGVHRNKLAHRVAWELANGRQVPDGMQVCHRCDVRNCVNPEHLFLGTQKENIADMYAKGRESGCGVRGAKNPSARFDAKTASLIRLLVDCGVSYANLKALFGVSASTLSRLKLRQSWAHVPDLQAPEAA